MNETLEQRAVRRGRERAHRKEAAERAISILIKDSDRSVALVGAALVDAELEAAILRFVVPTDEADATGRKVFGPNGTMSSFSARIDLGIMLGIFGKPVASDLHIIRKVRNEFAHDLDAHDFDAPRPKAHLSSLAHIFHFIERQGEQWQLRQPYPGGEAFIANLGKERLAGRQLFLQTVIFFWGALWSAAPLGPHPVLNLQMPLPASH